MPFDPSTDKLVVPFVTGTTSNWTSSGAVLPAGVPGYDITTKNFKVGDGINTWSSLPVLDNKVNAMRMELTSVDGGTIFAAVTTPALNSSQLSDGNLRRFRLKFNQNNVPDGVGQTKVTFAGSGISRVIHTFDQKNLPKAGVVPGVFYDAWCGNVDGVFRLWVNIPAELMPPTPMIQATVSQSLLGLDAKRRARSFQRLQVVDDFDAITLENVTATQNVGLQGVEQLVISTAVTANLDLTWVRPGTTVEVLAANSTSNATVKFELPPGAIVIGLAASQFYSITNRGRVRIRRATVQGEDLWHFETIHGAAATVASGPAVARSRCLLLGGQSLALRFAQGFGPMALEKAFKARGLTGSTRVLNTAAGSSSLFYNNDNTVDKSNHWWDERTNIAGPLAIAAVASINSHLATKPVAEPAPALMVFNIGQNDADNIATTGVTTPVTVRSHYRKVADYIRIQTGLSSLVFAVDLLGADDGGAYSDAQCQMFRRAQLAACKTDGGTDDPLTRPGAEFFDLPRVWDDVHINLSGQELQAQRYADLWLNLVDGLVPDTVRLQGVEFLSHDFSAPFTHDVRLKTDWFNGGRYGFRRPVEHFPGGIALLPNAAPTLSDTPYELLSWSLIGTGVTNELIFRLVTKEPSSGAAVVLNWGRGGDEGDLAHLVRSVLTDRGFRSYDPRPLS